MLQSPQVYSFSNKGIDNCCYLKLLPIFIEKID